MTHQHKIQLFKEQLINDVGRFMKSHKYELIEFNPYFRISIESNCDDEITYIPVVVTYLHDDGTLGFQDHTEINISELSIHEIGYILDMLEMNNYIANDFLKPS